MRPRVWSRISEMENCRQHPLIFLLFYSPSPLFFHFSTPRTATLWMSRLNESIKRYKSGVCWLLMDSFSRKRSVVFKRGLKKKKGKGCLNTCRVVRTSDSTSSKRTHCIKYIYIYFNLIHIWIHIYIHFSLFQDLEKLALHDCFLFNFSFLPPHRISYIYTHVFWY